MEIYETEREELWVFLRNANIFLKLSSLRNFLYEFAVKYCNYVAIWL